MFIPEQEVLDQHSQAEVLADFRQAWHTAVEPALGQREVGLNRYIKDAQRSDGE